MSYKMESKSFKFRTFSIILFFLLFTHFNLQICSSESIPLSTTRGTVYKPRDRFPVHFKTSKIHKKLSPPKSTLPPLVDVTPSDPAPTVKIFEMGEREPVRILRVGKKFPNAQNTAKSLLDDTSAIGEEPKNPTVQPQGQETKIFDDSANYGSISNNNNNGNSNNNNNEESGEFVEEVQNNNEEQVGEESFFSHSRPTSPTYTYNSRPPTLLVPIETRPPVSSQTSRPIGQNNQNPTVPLLIGQNPSRPSLIGQNLPSSSLIGQNNQNPSRPSVIGQNLPSSSLIGQNNQNPTVPLLIGQNPSRPSLIGQNNQNPTVPLLIGQNPSSSSLSGSNRPSSSLIGSNLDSSSLIGSNPSRPSVIGVPILSGGRSGNEKESSVTRSLFGARNSGGTIRSRPSVVREQNKGVRKGVTKTTQLPEVINNEPNMITDYVFSDIKCYRTKQKEYFGAKIHMKSGFHVPYIRDRPQDPMTSSECSMEKTRESDTYHMKMNDLRGCGVEQCGDSMCVTMVFPRVPTLALADDEVTTIKCQPQKSSMSEMKTISFAGDSLENRRSASTVEGGGQEFAAEVGVFRQNPGTSNGLFVKRVNSGGVVQLGERLQLRSVVRGGDGWTFSKLSDVKVWRMRDSYSPNFNNLSPGDASEVITLVDSAGCRNSDYRVIAESEPIRDPRNDLVHHFTFKAFLFRGQRANEPLIITAKVHACQERDDCDIRDCQVSDDEYKRKKRQIDDLEEAKNATMNWDSHLALRVVGLMDHPSSVSETDFEMLELSKTKNSSGISCIEKMGGAALTGAFLVILIGSLVGTLVSFCKRGKRIEENYKTTAEIINSLQNTRRNSCTSVDLVRRHNENLGEVSPGGNSDKVSKLLKKIGKKEEDEEVYIVYCCNNRSKSCPPSLRSRKSVDNLNESDYEDEYEDEETKGHSCTHEQPRQTVRSVKKRSYKRQKIRERRGIPTIYRDESIKKNSFPSRGYKSRNYREESDSAYSTTSISSITNSEIKSNSELLEDYKKNLSTHFISRNENSTQIVIIPETNV